MIPNKEGCLIHEVRQLVRSDEYVATLRERGDPEELHRYLEEQYQSEWIMRSSLTRRQTAVC